MARGRIFAKSFSTSRRLGALVAQHGVPCPTCGGSLAEFAQGLYGLLIAHADDFGRQEGDSFTVKHRVHPLSPRSEADVLRALQALADVGLLHWYATPDGPVAAVVDFDTHQGGLHRRTHSAFPDPPPSSGNFREIPGTSRNPQEPPGIPGNVPELPSEWNGMESNGMEGNGMKNAPAALAPLPIDVGILTAMVRQDILPLGLSAADLPEAAKSRAAKLKLPYNSAAIAQAIAEAHAQTLKGVH